MPAISIKTSKNRSFLSLYGTFPGRKKSIHAWFDLALSCNRFVFFVCVWRGTAKQGASIEKQPCIFTLRTCQTCTVSSRATVQATVFFSTSSKIRAVLGPHLFLRALWVHISTSCVIIWCSTERGLNAESGERGVVLATLVCSAQLGSIICVCDVASDRIGMIHKDGGLVSSEAWAGGLIAALLLLISFSLPSLPSSLRPAVLWLSCSPLTWNASPTRCLEEHIGLFPPTPFFSCRHSLSLPFRSLNSYLFSVFVSLFPTSLLMYCSSIYHSSIFLLIPLPFIYLPSLFLNVWSGSRLCRMVLASCAPLQWNASGPRCFRDTTSCLSSPPLPLLPLSSCEVVLIRAALHVHGPERDADSALSPFLWFCFMSDMWALLASALVERKNTAGFSAGLWAFLMLRPHAGSLQRAFALGSGRGRPLWSLPAFQLFLSRPSLWLFDLRPLWWCGRASCCYTSWPKTCSPLTPILSSQLKIRLQRLQMTEGTHLCFWTQLSNSLQIYSPHF